MASEFRDLLLTALQADSPASAIEALIRDNPELPAAIGKSWADGFSADRIPPALARILVEHGAPLSVHAAAGFGFVDRLADLLTPRAATAARPFISPAMSLPPRCFWITGRPSTHGMRTTIPLPHNGASLWHPKLRATFSIGAQLRISSWRPH